METEKTYDMRFMKGATHLVVGPSACGKTVRTCKMLQLKNELIQGGENITNVVFFYSAWQDIYSQLQNRGIVTKFVKKKPSSDEFVQHVQNFTHKGGSIVVIDDFMSDIDRDMVDIVTVQSRHYNTTTFILFQSLFPPNRLARQISLNVKYIHLHKNPRENAQIGILARQIRPGNSGWIVAAYHKVTEEPHTSFLIDLTQEREEMLRFRSHYLPDEGDGIMRVYFPAGSNV